MTCREIRYFLRAAAREAAALFVSEEIEKDGPNSDKKFVYIEGKIRYDKSYRTALCPPAALGSSNILRVYLYAVRNTANRGERGTYIGQRGENGSEADPAHLWR